jgi:hypothetical protein
MAVHLLRKTHFALPASAEFLRVRCTGGRALAPQSRVADPENSVAHRRDGCPQLLLRDVTPPNVLQVIIAIRASSTAHSLEACVGAESVEARQQAAL